MNAPRRAKRDADAPPPDPPPRPTAPPLTTNEQRIGFVLAAAAAAAFVALRYDQPTRLGLGLVMAGLLGFTASRRARIRTTLACFVVAFGGPWGYYAIAGVVYAGFALWLLSRGAKSVAAGTATTGTAVTGPARTAGTRGARSGAAPTSAGSARTRGRAAPRPRSRRR